VLFPWWLTDEFKDMKPLELPNVNDFPCSNPHCNIHFKMIFGIFYKNHVFCTSKCLMEWETDK